MFVIQIAIIQILINLESLLKPCVNTNTFEIGIRTGLIKEIYTILELI
jgi:hypothetical protein